MRNLCVCLVASLLCAATLAAANPALGRWNCSSLGENGTKLEWTLSLTEQDGRIAATATLDGTDMTLFDVKLDGDLLTFKLRVNEQEVVSFELRIDGDRLSGRFEGKDSGKATVSGTRAA